MSNPVRDEAGEPIAVVTICEDITDRKRAEAALRASEERYALAARGANDGLWDWDLKTDQMYFAPRWKAMLGFDDPEIGTTPEEWFGRVHPEDRVRLRHEIDAHLAGLTPYHEAELRMLHKDGRYRWVLSRGVAVRDEAGKAYRVAGSQSDITERKLAEEQLRHDAFYDPLTGLPNRALFLDHLNGSIARAGRRPGYLFAVLFFDLDRFKNVNDSLGHSVGDQLLIEVAHRLHKCLRP